MTRTPASRSNPEELPLFPLPSVVLFPGVGLPLHIFEPRYRAMMLDALAGERQIGMVLLVPGGEPDSRGVPPIHRVGCKGEIVDEKRLPDGRWNLVLRGHTRFRIESETDGDKPYRIARATMIPEPVSDESGDRVSVRMSQLLMAVERLLGDSEEGKQVLGDLFGGAPRLSQVVDRVAAVFPFPVQVKQQILETLAPATRLELLLAAIEANGETPAPSAPAAPRSSGSLN